MKKNLIFSVRASSIHGRGLFADAPIASGKRIIEYTGQRIDDAEGERRDTFYNSIGYTLLIRLSSHYIDALIGGNEAIYINHSLAPNAEAVEHRGRVFIEALRDIEPGEEVTFDYGFDPVEMARKANADIKDLRSLRRKKAS
jgi:SET domain-containing protein